MSNKEDKKPVYKQVWFQISTALIIAGIVLVVLYFMFFRGQGMTDEQFLKNVAKSEGISLKKAKELYGTVVSEVADPFL